MPDITAQELPENQDPTQVHIGPDGSVTPYAQWVASETTAVHATPDTAADVAVVELVEETPAE